MTLAEIELLLKELQTQIEQNTAAIQSLTDASTKYTTKDELTAIATQVNTLQNNNTVLQDSVATLYTSINKIDFLSKLTDVTIDNLTEDDVLQYGHDGKWHNVNPSVLGITVESGGSANSLASLTDVLITGVSDGQTLTYSAINSKWVNKTINTESDSGSNYLTRSQADSLYLSLEGGSVDWLVVKGITELQNDASIDGNLLTTGGITMYNK